MRVGIHASDLVKPLCGAGTLLSVKRVGLPPLGLDSDLEFSFEGPSGNSIVTVTIGPVSASHVHARTGSALEVFFGHLGLEDPDEYQRTVALWQAQDEPLAAWALGTSLAEPHRLAMNHPYVEPVGFSFLCLKGEEPVGRLAIIGEADAVLVGSMCDPIFAPYQLETL